MNYTHYQITKGYMQETHEQAYRDYLARSLNPSFRERLANVLTMFAAVRLEGKTRAESVEFAPTPKLVWVGSHATPVQIPGR